MKLCICSYLFHAFDYGSPLGKKESRQLLYVAETLRYVRISNEFYREKKIKEFKTNCIIV